ncbi:MAG: hypothetical protein AB1847_20970 [bacterium]
MTVTGRGSTDEAVVVVKLGADKDTVTYLRGKHSASGIFFLRVLEAKGGTCNRESQISFGTTVKSPAGKGTSCADLEGAPIESASALLQNQSASWNGTSGIKNEKFCSTEAMMSGYKSAVSLK